jgi:hypothetical protein
VPPSPRSIGGRGLSLQGRSGRGFRTCLPAWRGESCPALMSSPARGRSRTNGTHDEYGPTACYASLSVANERTLCRRPRSAERDHLRRLPMSEGADERICPDRHS